MVSCLSITLSGSGAAWDKLSEKEQRHLQSSGQWSMARVAGRDWGCPRPPSYVMQRFVALEKEAE